jgi:hypothetical protein
MGISRQCLWGSKIQIIQPPILSVLEEQLLAFAAQKQVAAVKRGRPRVVFLFFQTIGIEPIKSIYGVSMVRLLPPAVPLVGTAT